MLSKPTLQTTALPEAPRGFGVFLVTALLLAVVAVVGAFGWEYILSTDDWTNEQWAFALKATILTMLLGSAVALVIAVVTARHLALGRWRRSWGSVMLAAVAALSALPGLYIASFHLYGFIYSRLPLTASELRAIEAAEKFVERNGYTSAGHPKDLPVLQNDIMDPLAGSEEGVLEMRKGTLQARAFGIKSVGAGFLVFFQGVPPDPTIGVYRTLEVDTEGQARILHQDMYPGYYKKAER